MKQRTHVLTDLNWISDCETRKVPTNSCSKCTLQTGRTSGTTCCIWDRNGNNQTVLCAMKSSKYFRSTVQLEWFANYSRGNETGLVFILQTAGSRVHFELKSTRGLNESKSSIRIRCQIIRDKLFVLFLTLLTVTENRRLRKQWSCQKWEVFCASTHKMGVVCSLSFALAIIFMSTRNGKNGDRYGSRYSRCVMCSDCNNSICHLQRWAILVPLMLFHISIVRRIFIYGLDYVYGLKILPCLLFTAICSERVRWCGAGFSASHHLLWV